jgi:AcrR family transcriptional regulator
VPRTVDLEKRDRLVDLVATDLVDNGLTGASLERLAKAAHTSARMLVHHFGSRETLVELALDRSRSRQLAAARVALPATPDFLTHVADAWPWFVSAQTRRYFKLSSQVASAEQGNEKDTVRGGFAREWLDLLQSGFVAAGHSPTAARISATILAAQLRGLFLDLDATDETSRVAEAYRRFVVMLQTVRSSPDA